MVKHQSKNTSFEISIIIPVADDSRNEYLNNLLSALDRQTHQNFEVILVIGDKRQGRAINKGVKEARGNWIVTMDDDTQVEDESLLEKMVAEMKADDSVGLGGAACVIPKSASSFQKRAMREIPRRFFPIQQETIDSDFVQHPCLIISKSLFEEIGGEDEDLIRGLDPILRQKVRETGKRVCILANTAVIHLLPDSWKAVFHMYRRNGQGSAFAYKFFPSRIYELTDGFDGGDFKLKRSIMYRLARRLYRLIESFLKANWVRQTVDVAYTFGWLEGWLLGPFPSDRPVINYQQEVQENHHNFILRRFYFKTSKASVDEQIARLHVRATRDFALETQDHPALVFYRDKVGVFRCYSGQGFLYETNDEGEVLGFLFLMTDPEEFKMTLIKKGYAFRYLLSVLTGRYTGTSDGWKKWLRLPVSYLKRLSQSSTLSSGARVHAFVVREDCRQQGIGSRLLKRAGELALAFDRHHLEVTVAKTNEPALRLYQRHGFEVAGEVMESTGLSWYLEKPIGVP